MARRDHRKGLATTTISVKLTAAELGALDDVRHHDESLFSGYRSYRETRGDALRRLISEAAERRIEEKKRSDPRQVTLNEAIAAAVPADKTENAGDLRKTRSGRAGAAPLRKIRRQVLPTGKKPHARRNSAIRR